MTEKDSLVARLTFPEADLVSVSDGVVRLAYSDHKDALIAFEILEELASPKDAQPPQPVADAGDVAGLLGAIEITPDITEPTDAYGDGYCEGFWDAKARYEKAIQPALTRLFDQIAKERDAAVDNYNRAWNQRDAQRRRAEAAESRLAELEQEAVKVVERVRHKKRGTEYEVLGIGKMQAGDWTVPEGNDPTEWRSVDMREIVVYRSLDDGSLWARPRDEFEDGRFEKIDSDKHRRPS